jgi:hypothetical protein
MQQGFDWRVAIGEANRADHGPIENEGRNLGFHRLRGPVERLKNDRFSIPGTR